MRFFRRFYRSKFLAFGIWGGGLAAARYFAVDQDAWLGMLAAVVLGNAVSLH